MKLFVLILLFISSISYGQSEAVCLNLSLKFELFKPQIGVRTKSESVTKLETVLTDSVYLLIGIDEKRNYDQNISGFEVYLINTTNNDIYFSVPYQRLICQAIDKNGDWVDIEYFENFSWGNDQFSEISLGHSRLFTIVVPCYTGTFETDLRYKFTIGDDVLYSQVFRGKINEGQIAP